MIFVISFLFKVIRICCCEPMEVDFRDIIVSMLYVNANIAYILKDIGYGLRDDGTGVEILGEESSILRVRDNSELYILKSLAPNKENSFQVGDEIHKYERDDNGLIYLKEKRAFKNTKDLNLTKEEMVNKAEEESPSMVNATFYQIPLFTLEPSFKSGIFFVAQKFMDIESLCLPSEENIKVIVQTADFLFTIEEKPDYFSVDRAFSRFYKNSNEIVDIYLVIAEIKEKIYESVIDFIDVSEFLVLFYVEKKYCQKIQICSIPALAAIQKDIVPTDDIIPTFSNTKIVNTPTNYLEDTGFPFIDFVNLVQEYSCKIPFFNTFTPPTPTITHSYGPNILNKSTPVGLSTEFNTKLKFINNKYHIIPWTKDFNCVIDEFERKQEKIKRKTIYAFIIIASVFFITTGLIFVVKRQNM